MADFMDKSVRLGAAGPLFVALTFTLEGAGDNSDLGFVKLLAEICIVGFPRTPTLAFMVLPNDKGVFGCKTLSASGSCITLPCLL